MSTTKFSVDYAKRVAACKKCRLQITKGELRLAKIVPNPFTAESDHPSDMKQYFHPHCLFESFTKCRATTKVIESDDDISGWDSVQDDDKEKIIQLIDNLLSIRSKKPGNSKGKKSEYNESMEEKNLKASKSSIEVSKSSTQAKSKSRKKEKEGRKSSEELEETNEDEKKAKKSLPKGIKRKGSEDGEVKQENIMKSVLEDLKDDSEGKISSISKYDSLKYFCKLCEVIASFSKYTDKSTAVKMFVSKDDYDGDLVLLAKFLIPSVDQRVYNLKEKQLIKIFSNILGFASEEIMDEFNESGEVSITIEKFFEKVKKIKKSTLSLQQIDEWLNGLAELTKEDEQENHFKKIIKKSTSIDLRYIIRLIMKDLRFNTGAKHILEGIRPGAYEVFQNTRDLRAVIEKSQKLEENVSMLVDSDICLGVAIKPMLAEPCRSVGQAMKKWKTAMYSEIKYDGERVQIHKNGTDFHFFSRSLKPVQKHKISHLSSVLPEAFPDVQTIVLDSEILLVDTETGKPLPFGTLGVHKKEKFENASVCLFIFDCLYFEGQSMVNRPLKDRKKVLVESIKEIPNRILLSNYEILKTNENSKLSTMIWKTIDEGLEGLVLKDIDSIYEPGKRHWLKIKKDYLEEGKMADAADLIVLGAYYGTGCKGGMMSVFLMGVYDLETKKFLTVTKCGNGHTDEALDRINLSLKDKMQKISRNYDLLPKWIKCSRNLVPDFIMKDPTDSMIWEISGAQFSKSETHTAAGISIRFPRVTKIRDDKTWETATNLEELKALFDKSQIKSDLDSSINDEIPLFNKEHFNDPRLHVHTKKEIDEISKDLEKSDEMKEVKEESRAEEKKKEHRSRKSKTNDTEEKGDSKRRRLKK